MRAQQKILEDTTSFKVRVQPQDSSKTIFKMERGWASDSLSRLQRMMEEAGQSP